MLGDFTTMSPEQGWQQSPVSGERPRSVGAITRSKQTRQLPRSVLAAMDPEQHASHSGGMIPPVSTPVPSKPKGASYLPFAHRPKQWQALLGLEPDDESQPI